MPFLVLMIIGFEVAVFLGPSYHFAIVGYSLLLAALCLILSRRLDMEIRMERMHHRHNQELMEIGIQNSVMFFKMEKKAQELRTLIARAEREGLLL